MFGILLRVGLWVNKRPSALNRQAFICLITYMETFDWESCEKVRSKNVVEWLKENHALPVTLDRFVTEMRLIHKMNRSTGKKKHLSAYKFAKKHSGYKLKREYKWLTEKFGFFK